EAGDCGARAAVGSQGWRGAARRSDGDARRVEWRRPRRSASV
ncbi:MAG: hypothetical protein AVDCRST_MAG87-1559, partial [uncultured Thermomicrobiales bacterium]